MFRDFEVYVETTMFPFSRALENIYGLSIRNHSAGRSWSLKKRIKTRFVRTINDENIDPTFLWNRKEHWYTTLAAGRRWNLIGNAWFPNDRDRETKRKTERERERKREKRNRWKKSKVGFSKHCRSWIAWNRIRRITARGREIASDVRFGFNRRPPNLLTISFVLFERREIERRTRER